jgi:hypothetical protein
LYAIRLVLNDVDASPSTVAEADASKIGGTDAPAIDAATAVAGQATPSGVEASGAAAKGDANMGADDGASTFAKYVCSLPDAKKALDKYIAGFSQQSPVLGHAPPCRSFRSLILMDEFDTYGAKIREAKSKSDIAEVQNSLKPFRGAAKDLLSMCKAAVTRLENAKKSVIKSQDEAKGDTRPSNPKRGRPRRADPLVTPQTLFRDAASQVDAHICEGVAFPPHEV